MCSAASAIQLTAMTGCICGLNRPYCYTATPSVVGTMKYLFVHSGQLCTIVQKCQMTQNHFWFSNPINIFEASGQASGFIAADNSC